MAAPPQVELAADCPSCGLESGLVETFAADAAACAFGIPKVARCKLCALTYEGRVEGASDPVATTSSPTCPGCGASLDTSTIAARRCAACGAEAKQVLVSAAISLRTPQDLSRALDTWATREGFASAEALLHATFEASTLEELFRRIDRGLPLPVLADPFARWGARSVESREPVSDEDLSEGAAPDAFMYDTWDEVEAPPPTDRSPLSSRPPRSRRTSPPSGAPDPLAVVYPLLSVAAADGEIHPKERQFVLDFALREGIASLASDLFRVHPFAAARLVPPARREEILKAMSELAAIDGMVDESERRVIDAYRMAWGIPTETVSFWLWGYDNMSASLARQVWLRIQRFLLPVRWGEGRAPHPPTTSQRSEHSENR